MSTQYTLFKRGDLEFEADERSALIDLAIHTQDGYDIGHTIERLTAEEIVGIALELLKVASYVNGDLRGMGTSYLRTRSDRSYYQEIVKELWLNDTPPARPPSDNGPSSR
jgi:hypothetical protein